MQTGANDISEEETPLFLAGHAAPAGTYCQVETGREVRLEREGILPATLDGRIAVYQRHQATWAERHDDGTAHLAEETAPKR